MHLLIYNFYLLYYLEHNYLSPIYYDSVPNLYILNQNLLLYLYYMLTMIYLVLIQLNVTNYF